MDYYRRSTFSSPFPSADTLFNLDDLSPKSRAHLQNVYVTLAAGMLVAAAGFTLALPLGLWSIGFSIACMLGLAFYSESDAASRSRRGGQFGQAEMVKAALFGGFTFFQGTALAPIGELYPNVVAPAFIGAFFIFASLTASAFTSPRRSYFFLGGVLGSMLSISIWLGFLNFFFFRSEGIAIIQVYGGLLMFLGFVLFDTQIIIERSRSANADVFRDAVLLFTDAVGIFIRLVRILSDKERKRRNN